MVLSVRHLHGPAWCAGALGACRGEGSHITGSCHCPASIKRRSTSMQTNNNQKPYEYRQNERRTSYTVNPDEAALVRQIYTRVGSQENQGTAIYARSAAGENAALAVQIDQCMRYAEEYGYTVNDQHVYQE